MPDVEGSQVAADACPVRGSCSSIARPIDVRVVGDVGDAPVPLVKDDRDRGTSRVGGASLNRIPKRPASPPNKQAVGGARVENLPLRAVVVRSAISQCGNHSRGGTARQNCLRHCVPAVVGFPDLIRGPGDESIGGHTVRHEGRVRGYAWIDGLTIRSVTSNVMTGSVFQCNGHLRGARDHAVRSGSSRLASAPGQVDQATACGRVADRRSPTQIIHCRDHSIARINHLPLGVVRPNLLGDVVVLVSADDGVRD